MYSSFINKSTFFVCAFAMIFFISCEDKKSKENVEQSPQSTEETVNDATKNSSENNSDVTLNPPHGQPGHRCDIQVGQPLPSGSAAKSSPVINTSQKSPVINNTGSVPVNNSNSTAKVNPPHGQPGHKCEIPVGAPLE
ncbi:MAG: hypothetical protein NXH73_05850 [Flavobacteriaceae bacterium]|nr:hypothetical protein [Flavobacteriaceae bacterium]